MPDNPYRQDLVSVYQEGWLTTMSITTMCSVSHKLCVRLFTLCKISTQFCESCGATYRRCIIGYAILPQTGTKLTKNAVLNLALCCGANWRHGEKPQYWCTTTIHHVYNCSKKILENLPPVGLLVRTNLFIASRFGLSIRILTIAVCAM